MTWKYEGDIVVCSGLKLKCNDYNNVKRRGFHLLYVELFLHDAFWRGLSGPTLDLFW